MKSIFQRVFYAVVATVLTLVFAVSALMLNLMSENEKDTRLESMKNQAHTLATTYDALRRSQNLAYGFSALMQQQAEALFNSLAETASKEFRANIVIVDASGIANWVVEWGDVPDILLLHEAEYLKLASGQASEIFNMSVISLGEVSVTVGVPVHDPRDSQTVNGVLYISTRQSNLASSYRAAVPKVLLRGAIALLFGMMISWFIAMSIAMPVRHIASVSRAIAKGDFSKRVLFKNRQDEVGELGKTFNDMAETLDSLEEVRKAFVANVSHELRSPMTSIQGYVQGMLDGVIPPEDYPRYLQVVNDEAKRLTNLVNELLDLSRIEGGNIPLDIMSFDVNELARRVLVKFEGRIEGKRQGISLRYRTQTLRVEADPARIEQVIANLVDNASKFSPEGGHITLTTYINGNLAVIAVSDDGPGIAAEDLPYVFDRFYKADKAHSGHGTGLGLSITKKLLEQHGQQIVVRSEPGHGATFAFTLKLAPGQASN